MLDVESFAALFADSYQRCWLIAAAITGDRVEADDIVQEASLVALRKRAEFTTGTNFAAWIGQIVRLTALNYAKKSIRRHTVVTEPEIAGRVDASVAAITEDGRLAEHQSDFDDDVVLALQQISEEARACLLLRVVQQLSYSEIAEVLQIPEGTAMSHVHRAKLSMRERLRHHQEQSADFAKNGGQP